MKKEKQERALRSHSQTETHSTLPLRTPFSTLLLVKPLSIISVLKPIERDREPANRNEKRNERIVQWLSILIRWIFTI
jgi:hypothetical protein